mgnify:CR=1 FL=1
MISPRGPIPPAAGIRDDAPVRGLPGIGWFLTLVLGLGIALPLHVSVGEVELAAGIAEAVAVASIFLLLPAQFLADTGKPRLGGTTRLLVLGMVITSLASWANGVLEQGFSLGALLSMLNWIALGGMVVLGQVLVGDLRRLGLLLGVWAAVQAAVAAGSVVYLVGRFGSSLVTATARGPFQHAMHELLPSWPNEAGLAFAVAACLCFGRLRGGHRGLLLRAELLVLTAGVLVTFSRNAWLASFAGVLTIAVAARHRRGSLVLPVGAVVMVPLLALLLPPVRYQIASSWRPGTSEQLSLVARLAFATEALRIWLDHPFLGVGFARFDQFASLGRLSTVASVAAGYVPGSVHNEYLSTLVKGGLVSAASFAAFLLASGWRFLGLARHAPPASQGRPWGVVGLGLLAALVVGGFGGESFRHIAVSGPFWLLAGGLSVLGPIARRSRARRPLHGEQVTGALAAARIDPASGYRHDSHRETGEPNG